MGSQARATHLQVTHMERYQLFANTPSAATGVVFGHLPQGARISSCDIYVETPFNAGSGNTISVGYQAEVNGTPIAAITPQTQLVSAGTATAAAQTKTTPTAPNGVITTDVALVATFNSGGAAATTGVATIVVTYFPNL